MSAHGLKSKTILIHRDAMGNVKQKRVIHSSQANQSAIDIEIFSESGLLIRKETMPFRSFIGNFIHILAKAMSGSALNPSLKRLNGTTYTDIDMMLQNDSPSDGIYVGSGNTAVSLDDYDLASRIVIGTGAGQLQMNNMQRTQPAKVGSTSWKIEVTRTFTNNSGGNVDIKEVGLLSSTNGTVANSNAYFIARDVINKDGIPINITLSNGQSVQFTYRMFMDLSEGFVKGFAVQVNNGMSGAYLYGVPYGDGLGMNTLDVDGDNIFGNGFYSNTSDSPEVNAGIGVDYGIRVGTGSTAVTLDDNQVEGLIAEGSGAGELNHSAVTFDNLVTNGDNRYFAIKRVVTNNSGADITIGNYGVVARNYTAYSAYENRRLLVAKKLTGGITIANGEPLEIIHQIGIEV